MRSKLLGVGGTFGVVALFAIVAGVSACGQAQAAGRAGEWVEVVPSTATAGALLQIRADCGDNTKTATVTSRQLKTITMQPQYGVLFAEVQVPPRVAEGAEELTLHCGSGATATTTLWLSTRTTATPPPSIGPHTGGGFLANGGSASAGARRLTGPIGWFAGGLIALLAGAAAAGVSVRRRRRGSVH